MKQLFCLFFVLLSYTSVAFADQECDGKSQSLDSLVQNYFETASQNNSNEAYKIYQKIQDLLNQSEGFSEECRDQLLLQYAMDSLTIPNQVSTVQFKQDISAFRQNGALKSALEVMHRKQKIVFITPAMRKNQGGEWANQDILGGYDCASSQIYLDPQLPPFDLAISVIHEFWHLQDDKYGPAPDVSKSFDWDQYHFNQEYWNIMLTAAIQYDLQGLHASSDHRSFVLDHDLTLFSKKGLLFSLFSKNHYEAGAVAKSYKKMYGDEPMDSSFFLSNYGFASRILEYNAPPYVLQDTHGMGHVLKHMNDVFGNIDSIKVTIWQNYFTNPSNFKPAKDSSEPNIMGGFVSDKDAAVLMEFPMFRNFNAGVLDGPSPTCRLYMQSLLPNTVASYLGTRFNPTGSAPTTFEPCLRIRKPL